MNAFDAVRKAATSANIPITHIGPSMGKNAAYISSAASRGSSPQANTLAAIADVLGYSLVLVPSGDVPESGIVIDE